MKNMQEEISRSRKVALFKSLDSDYYMIDEFRLTSFDENYRPLPNGEERERIIKGYVRISEPIEVSFSSMASDSIIQKAVESLDALEADARRELNEKIAAIREQKSQLLALTYQAEVVS
jgi:hypothetical protein